LKSDSVFLHHILDEIEFLLKVTKGLDYESFLQNDLLTRATARSIEIIGEASKNLSSEFRKRHKDVAWKQFAGMRDKVIHQYFGVNWVIVWDVVHSVFPDVKHRIEQILAETKLEETP
jgi:uncharacterized protein with HEPN domain